MDGTSGFGRRYCCRRGGVALLTVLALLVAGFGTLATAYNQTL
ncbi:MAG: hypothetical protein C0P79_014625 [Gammaproteobacteria bacterium]